MLQSIKQMKSFLRYPIIPNSRTGHQAESMKPRLVCMIQSSKNMQYIQCWKGKEVATEGRHFSEETTEAALRSLYFIFHAPLECQQSHPGHLTTFPLPPSWLKKSGKACACREGRYFLYESLCLNVTRISPEWVILSCPRSVNLFFI